MYLYNPCKSPEGRGVATSGQVGLSQALPTLPAVHTHIQCSQTSTHTIASFGASPSQEGERERVWHQDYTKPLSLVTGVSSQRLLEAADK